ncbi:MAG TPA: histidine--tRNA ligase [Candidatus Acidoferrum sp.]|nr:histidine--tRNA ligase [Candidatus Acidoferrum sp.]
MSEGPAKSQEKPRKFQAIRGTRDLLPPETALWNRVEQTAHEVFATFGFGEIRVPIFEPTELFARSIGVDTDVVSKEMYEFEDHASRELAALRTLLLEKEPKIDDPKFFLSYELKVEEFLNRLQFGMNDGTVPGTRENERVCDEIRPLLNSIGFARQEYEKDQGQVHANRFDLYISHIRNDLKAVRTQATRTFLGDDVTLRPEATASVCRAYIEHNMQQLPQPVKLYYMGPMFRRERPQKGRYRQFYQIGAEILGGTDAPAIDAEVIEMVMVFFAKLELQGVQLDINSIGCRDCRPKYVELLRAELLKVKDELGADSQRRIETNPLRVLDSKLESEQAIIEKLPRIADHLCQDCATHYAAVKRQLELRGVIYRENWRLVRGLDYYMRTTFEITAVGLGSQDAVCGGGRYDGLVELLGGPPTKGIGFAIGEDRLILSLQESGVDRSAVAHKKAQPPQGRDVYIAWMGEKAHATAIRAAKDLRAAGFSVELPPTEQKFGKALGHADKLGARYALILGDDEVAEGLWTLKTLADGKQDKFTEQQLLEHLRKTRALSS